MHSKLFVLRKEKGVTQKEMASLIGLSSDGYKNKEGKQNSNSLKHLRLLSSSNCL